MIKELVKQHFDQWITSAINITFTRVFTMSTVLGIAGIIIHNFYPEYAAQFDTSLSGILIYVRGKNVTINTQ